MRHSAATNFLVNIYAARLSGDGSVLDTNGLWLSPPPRLGLTVLGSTNPTTADLDFTGVPGVNYSVEASSNLLHWDTLGAATEGAGGQFHFQDCSNALARFYRLTIP